MNHSNKKFWPFPPRYSMILSIVLLAIFMLLLKLFSHWPSDQSENLVLVLIVIFSFIPVMLSLLDIVIERGGAFEIKGIKIDFARVGESSLKEFDMPQNIGVPGGPVTDSGTAQILHELKQATANEIVVVDLLEGEGWWETRLLVLLAGAARLGKPQIVVFAATDGGHQKMFQGWGFSESLLRCLLKTDPLYQRCLSISRAAARQWSLVEPLYPVAPGNLAIPTPYDWMMGKVSTQHSWMAFPAEENGEPNELLAEQILANELGNMIEMVQGGIRKISMQRLDDIFKPVLVKKHIDKTWTSARQREQFFSTQTSFVALTNAGRYVGMASIISVFNSLLDKIFRGKEES